MKWRWESGGKRVLGIHVWRGATGITGKRSAEVELKEVLIDTRLA